jgi:VIT1/CCC1 family predicted Fe2+/Mn2+ transporter
MPRLISSARRYIGSIIFGVEDSLVSTTGTVAGIAAGSQDPKLILLAGIVTVAVEAVSMAAGEFLSREAVQEVEHSHKLNLYRDAGLMFVSYSLAGLIPILPVALLPFPASIYCGVGLAMAGLYALGLFKGRIVGSKGRRSGLEMLIVGGAATLIGIVVGLLLKSYSA